MSINKDIIEINPVKININDIFDKKVELGPLLQFNLLQKVIEEFIDRQKKTDEKINKLENKLNKIYLKEINGDININNIYNELEENDLNKNDINIKDIEEIDNKDKLNNEEKNYDDELLDNKNINNLNEEDKKDNLNFSGENIEKTNKKDNNIIDENVNKEKDEINELNNINININDNRIQKSERKGSSLNQDKILNQLQSKINKLEKKYIELLNKFSSLNNDYKRDLQLLRAKNNGNEAKLSKQEKQIKELSEKLADINIYDLFKGDSDDINIDKATILIKGIDQRLSKKIEFLDIRTKTNEEDIFKLKNDIIDMKNSNDAVYQLSKNIKENYNKLLNDTDSKLNLFQKKYDEISNLKEIIDNSISKTDLLKFSEEQNQKINDLLSRNYSQNNGDSGTNSDLIQQLNDISEGLKTYVNKNLEDTEKFLKNYITNLGIDSINKEILKIKQELTKKLNKENLGSINLKIEQIENIQDNFKLQLDEIKNDLFCCNDKCSKAIGMVEYIRGQILNLNKEEKKESTENTKKEDNNTKPIDIDLSEYITKDNFNQEINKIYKKIEKIANLESDNYRDIQSIEERLKHFASESALTNIEQYLINLIDEYKIKDSKKYVEKSEHQKSIKYLEIQIKHLQDMNSKDNENWLLAKKPINNYMCASCEAYLGDLKNKEEYSAWNKIPSREDYNKKYRLGHGFSKMLKMVNMDLLKKVQRTNSGANIGIKIDGIKKLNLKNLPKINLQNQIDSSIQNINFNSDEENIEKINNSADNIENSNVINEPIKSEKNLKTERMINKSNNINSINISLSNIKNNDDEKPKVIKIFKKNKK